MSFKKLQIINPNDIGSPEDGHIYLGRDSKGLWEKYSTGAWLYITTGTTTGSGTSGISGSSGKDGADGSFYGSSGSSGSDGLTGTSGTSGSSGRTGIAGTSGITGTSGTSGTTGTSGHSGSSGSSGTSGSSGSSGTSGSSGSSGVDGNFYGSSGTSGYSGGYGGATRRWIAMSSYPPGTSGFYGTSSWAGGKDFTLIDSISINKIDADGDILSYWMNTWQTGILKIENRLNNSIFGIYDVINYPLITGNIYTFTGMTCRSGYGSISTGSEYLISFVPDGGTGPISYYFLSGSTYTYPGTPGTSGTSGYSYPTNITVVNSNYTSNSGDTYLRIIESGLTITIHEASGSGQELKIKGSYGTNGYFYLKTNTSTIDFYPYLYPVSLTHSLTGNTYDCLYIKDGYLYNWDTISYYCGAPL